MPSSTKTKPIKTVSKNASKTTKTKKPNSKTAKSKTVKTPRQRKLKMYCGILQPIPAGYKLGSMKECLDAKQVRYYGLKKIDNKLIESVNVKKETKSDIFVKIAGLKGKLSKLKRDIDNNKNKEDKKKLETEFETVRKQMILLNDKMQKMN